MDWTISYYDDSVQEEILAMPPGFLGRYLRYSDRMEVYGPDLGMPPPQHQFIKKTDETPSRELETARRRMKEFKNAHSQRT